MKAKCEKCGYIYKEGGQRVLVFQNCNDGKDHCFCEKCIIEYGREKHGLKV